MKLEQHKPVEIWGGIECTINRVADKYLNQLDYSGHEKRASDIGLFAQLGLKKIRYPVLWEKHKPHANDSVDWSQTEPRLNELKSLGIEVIAGLVHHGSGPEYVIMLEDNFAEGLAAFAKQVAQKFPWLEYYTPVNEPLTTARFCGLYGLWYPHERSDRSFCRILINECKGTVLAMQAIRQVNPDAKLVQTDDLGKIHSTPGLKYQADFENKRRWLSYDLLCGKVNEKHPLWKYLLNSGITAEELYFFYNNPCVPHIMGFNHYLTSERYLDDNINAYPVHTHGGNRRHIYADVEAVRVGTICPDGPFMLLKEAWERYRLPMAVTEVHLYCTREEQMRWLRQIWETAGVLRREGVDIRAITPWAMLGSFGWNKLLTEPKGDYEPGLFDLGNGDPRPTVLGKMVSTYSENNEFTHPVLDNKGWWQRGCRVIYGEEKFYNNEAVKPNTRPLLITGRTGTLGNAFARICQLRGIHYHLSGRDELDITDPIAIEKILLEINPWAVINTAGFVRVDDAEINSGSCFAINTQGPENLAILCQKYGIKMLTYSSDLVFNGHQAHPYTEYDRSSPLNVYGKSKAMAEQKVLKQNPNSLVVRTSAFFGPWDKYNFISVALDSLKNGKIFNAVNNVTISPTYVPDLVNTSLDLLLDDEKGIWHLSNNGQTSWADLAYTVAERKGLDTGLIRPIPLQEFGFRARMPEYSVLKSNRGVILPQLDNAIDRCLDEMIS